MWITATFRSVTPGDIRPPDQPTLTEWEGRLRRGSVSMTLDSHFACRLRVIGSNLGGFHPVTPSDTNDGRWAGSRRSTAVTLALSQGHVEVLADTDFARSGRK